jgi:hypothetical protein
MSDKILSVTGGPGKETIFRDTPLSRQMGLKPGQHVPDDLDPDVLLWVESPPVVAGKLDPQVVHDFREILGITPEELDELTGFRPGTIWEVESQRGDL